MATRRLRRSNKPTTETKTNHRPPPPTGLPYPWLLFCHGKRFKKQTFCALSPSTGCRIQCRNIPILRDKAVLGCSLGWLVLLHRKQTLCTVTLWNPLKLKSIVLPQFESTTTFNANSCILSSTPGSGTTDSTLVLLDRNQPDIMFCRTDGGGGWSKKQYREQMINDGLDCSTGHYFLVSAAYCNGVLYVTTNWCKDLMRIDMDSDKLVLVPIETMLPPLQAACMNRIFKVESRGQLFVIHVNLGGIGWDEVIAIQVYRLDSGEKKWERVDNIGDQVFFLGTYGSVSCQAVSELDKGRLYFTDCKENLTYSYKIEDGSLSIAFCSPELEKSRRHPIWVMPASHRLSDDQTKSNNEIAKKDAPTQSDAAERNLLDLPQCIIESLAQHLNFLDYMNFRAVCRVFALGAPTIRWRKALILESEKHYLSPWLMLSSEGRRKYTLINSKLNGRYSTTIPKELTGATICCSKDGWLLMSRSHDSMFFFNPLTRAVLPCPNLPPIDFHVVSFVLSSAPTYPDYMIMVMGTIDGEGEVHCCSIRRGDQRWFDTVVETGSKFVPNHNSTTVVCQGCFNFLGQNGNILQLEYKEGGWFFNFLKRPEAICDCGVHQNFLVECGGTLHSVLVGELGKWVRVFKFDQSLIWKEVESLGNQTLFLSRSSSFSIEAISAEMANRIYFPRLHKGSLVFYSLNTRKFHTADGDDSFMEYTGTAEQLQCGWIEPKWSEDQCAH